MLTLQRPLGPTHENIPVRQNLVIASSKSPITLAVGVVILRDNACRHRVAAFVQRDEDAAGESVGGVVGVVEALGVVEDGNEGVGLVSAAVAEVVLAGEFEGVDVGEVGFEAAEAPDDGAVFAGDFVDGVGVAAGEEVVAFEGFVDGVCVAAKVVRVCLRQRPEQSRMEKRRG